MTRPGLLGLVLAALSGAVVGALLTVALVHAAASRTAPEVVVPVTSPGPSGAPHVRGALDPGNGDQSGLSPEALSLTAPTTGAAPTPAAPLRGIASYVGRSFGPRYLALPQGRGIRARICGPAACVVRVSTDAGPDLAMQRAGRVADLSWFDFRTVCGCRPESVGLVRVSVSVAAGPAPTLPATSTETVP